MERRGLPVPRVFRIRAVLFDFDGTLTRPGAIDFDGLRGELGCPDDVFVLEHIRSLEGNALSRAQEILDRFEIEGAERSTPNPGAEEAVARLHEMGVPVGIVTRNSRTIVESALRNFERLGPGDFSVMVTRDDVVEPKPDPEAIHHAAARLGVAAEDVAMVGDFVVDVEAGRAAGAVTVHLREDDDAPDYEADFTIDSLTELDAIVRLGAPLAPGKLPNYLLDSYLGTLTPQDVSVVLPPGVGQDVAAVAPPEGELIVVHSDPITLASDRLGHSSVIVNANDIAASGAVPRWLLTTVLLPVGTTPSEALALLGDVARSCARASVSLVGGHTEVTDVVSRPVISGTMFGTVARASLRDKADAREGDRVIVTKGIAVEGTALFAQELRERLLVSGLSEDELEGCLDLADEISIVEEARTAASFAGVRAMHDVTEGGVATALYELGVASGRGLEVDLDAIPVLPGCRRVCDLLGADPLGLIGSGSLLIVCSPDDVASLRARLSDAGISSTVIGTCTADTGVSAVSGGREVAFPTFQVDEAARLLG